MTDELIPDPDLLTSRDLLRAREVLQVDNPWERLTDPVHRWPMTIWCLKTRTDPGFTYEQALDMPFGTVVQSEEPDPQTPPPSGNGERPGHAGGKASKQKPPDAEPAPAASATSV